MPPLPTWPPQDDAHHRTASGTMNLLVCAKGLGPAGCFARRMKESATRGIKNEIISPGTHVPLSRRAGSLVAMQQRENAGDAAELQLSLMSRPAGAGGSAGVDPSAALWEIAINKMLCSAGARVAFDLFI